MNSPPFFCNMQQFNVGAVMPINRNSCNYYHYILVLFVRLTAWNCAKHANIAPFNLILEIIIEPTFFNVHLFKSTNTLCASAIKTHHFKWFYQKTKWKTYKGVIWASKNQRKISCWINNLCKFTVMLSYTSNGWLSTRTPICVIDGGMSVCVRERASLCISMVTPRNWNNNIFIAIILIAWGFQVTLQ